jgi:hypothetical protein
MNAFEFESRLHHQDQLTIPHAVAAQLKDGQRVRVVLMVIDSDADVAIEAAPRPWDKYQGTWDPKDPVIGEWLKCIAENRREVDADPNIL